ncbi:hypothetical protein [Azospirillum sp.]|uniref:hypothetical protein n=1 Tax=Azospirillum sp. TaxID=34012 RepID=UPI002D6A5865|nr:hypothetical protein [Azospirillum sp.]HYD65559.1 hypothetical protein [Azospirillum sp.]
MAFLPKLGRSALPPLRQAPCQEDEGHDLCDAANAKELSVQEVLADRPGLLVQVHKSHTASNHVQLFEFSAARSSIIFMSPAGVERTNQSIFV